MKYAPSTGCFYPTEEITYENLPSDAVEVDQSVFKAWCEAPAGSSILISNGEFKEILPPPEPSLGDVKLAKIATLTQDYQAAQKLPVPFTTAAGASKLFTQDSMSLFNLDQAIANNTTSSWKSINLWLDASGLPVAPFTYADLGGLRAAIEAFKSPSYADLLKAIGAVDKATTADAVQSITL